MEPVGGAGWRQRPVGGMGFLLERRAPVCIIGVWPMAFSDRFHRFMKCARCMAPLQRCQARNIYLFIYFLFLFECGGSAHFLVPLFFFFHFIFFFFSYYLFCVCGWESPE